MSLLDLWLDFVAFEAKHGRARDMASVKNRAAASLGKKESAAFCAKYATLRLAD